MIRKQKKKMVCLNDSDYDFDFEKHRRAWLGALAEILPEPSSFEKGDALSL